MSWLKNIFKKETYARAFGNRLSYVLQERDTWWSLGFYGADPSPFWARFWLALGADPNYDDGTPLSRASSAGDVKTVRRLLQAGADPNKGDALYRSIRNEKEEILQILLSAGADPNTGLSQYYHDSPLLYFSSLRNYSRKCGEMLIDAGADINAVHKGVPLVHHVISSHNADMLDLLISRGVVLPNAPGQDTALHLLAGRDNSEAMLASLLGAGLDVNAVGGKGYTPLHRAAGHAKLCQAFLQAGARIDVVGHDGRTPLMFACASEKMEIDTISKLIPPSSMAGFLAQADEEGKTALMYAAYAGKAKTCKVLMSRMRRADIRLNDAQGNNLLWHAVGSGNTDVVKTVYEVASVTGQSAQGTPVIDKSFVNQQNSAGETPLMRAVDQLKIEMVEWLLEQGADPRLKDIQGNSAHDRAMKKGGRNIAKKLIVATDSLYAREKEEAVRQARFQGYCDAGMPLREDKQTAPLPALPKKPLQPPQAPTGGPA